MKRKYRMGRRAVARNRTRDRIVQATMQLHDEKGVAPTTFSDIARRARLGPATVLRHFPTIGDLVLACGAHVWVEMRPPTPDAVAATFAGLAATHDRLRKLVDELDAFYARGAHRLRLAARDRELIPELDAFLKAVETGIEALVREALAADGAREDTIQVALALMSFPMWLEFGRLDRPQSELAALKVRILECGIRATR